MAIDRSKVIEQMSKVSVEANPDGLIPAFNVLINAFPADFWNTFTYKMVDAVNEDIKDAVEELFVNAAHECGYHTGYGIITSKEWDAIVKPMVENTEDVLHGAYAVFTAWGPGDGVKQKLLSLHQVKRWWSGLKITTNQILKITSAVQKQTG